jgi:hypothetical protein
MGIPKSTLRTIRKQVEKIKKSCKSAIRMTSKTAQIRLPITEKLERMLALWTQYQHQRATPLSTMIIQAKQLTEFFKYTDTAAGITDDNNACRERNGKVTKAIESVVACYKELNSRGKKLHVSSLPITSSRVESFQSTGSVRQPFQPNCAPHSPASSESSD